MNSTRFKSKIENKARMVGLEYKFECSVACSFLRYLDSLSPLNPPKVVDTPCGYSLLYELDQIMTIVAQIPVKLSDPRDTKREQRDNCVTLFSL